MRLIRLVLVSGVFLGWLGYLGYLVANRPHVGDAWPMFGESWPLVVSRPQVMTSRVDVIAELPAPPGMGEVEVEVVEVLYPEGASVPKTIKVSHLEACHPIAPPRGPVPPKDWSAAGRYLLPLVRVEGSSDQYRVAAVPLSPGFDRPGVYRIYPDTPETRAQYERIEKDPSSAAAKLP
jgi:hypothetical protein